MKKNLRSELAQIETDLYEMSEQMYHHPEIGDEEYESMKLLVTYLVAHGFEVETGIVGRPTAFKATFSSGQPGPTIAYLAEYDALPGIGHGCGHNLIGTMSVGAGVILSKHLSEYGGNIIVFGTPAEETNGAKVPMSAAGIFDEVDVAMILHPNSESSTSGDSLAMDAIEFQYTGQSAHAAAAPEQGVNALDSVLHLFNGVNALREHVSSDVRIHGIISEGGQAANIVPGYAAAQFYIRAADRSYLDEVVAKVKNIAQGAALMTGASLEMTNYELSYDNMVTNETLSTTFTNNLQTISQHPIKSAKLDYGSIDMGDVSQVVPAIHPYISLNKADLVAHTTAFADQTITQDGRQALHDGALALAETGYDILTDASLLAAIKSEFQIQLKGKKQ